jgi:hypothetical protein
MPMKMILALLLLATIPARAAEMPADGLYLAAMDKSGTAYQSQDGQTVYLGARSDLNIVEKLFKSEGNDNDTFRLVLSTPYRTSAVGWYVLVVNGTVYRQDQSYGDTVFWRLQYHVAGDDRAKEVSDYLGVPIVYYRHPGHRLRVTITPTEESFARGADVTATLRIVNIGTEPVAFVQGARNTLNTQTRGRDNQFTFAASLRGKPVPDIGITSYSGGIASQVVLKPGEDFRVLVHLNQWFDFKDTGTYRIHGSYYMIFMAPEPRDYSAFWVALQQVPEGTIWTDHVGADFQVAIQ